MLDLINPRGGDDADTAAVIRRHGGWVVLASGLIARARHGHHIIYLGRLRPGRPFQLRESRIPRNCAAARLAVAALPLNPQGRQAWLTDHVERLPACLRGPSVLALDLRHRLDRRGYPALEFGLVRGCVGPDEFRDVYACGVVAIADDPEDGTFLHLDGSESYRLDPQHLQQAVRVTYDEATEYAAPQAEFGYGAKGVMVAGGSAGLQVRYCNHLGSWETKIDLLGLLGIRQPAGDGDE